MQKHKILSFLLALLVSVGLWVYAVTVVNPDDSKTISDIKVSFVGLSELSSKNLILTGGKNQRITVEVSGRRSDLKELNNTSLEVVADLSNIDAAGNYEVSWTLDPPSTVASGDISVVTSSANRVQVSVSEYMERPSIPVTVENDVTPAEGYLCDAAVLSTESLSVSGPAEEVSKIAKAVVKVAQDDATQTVVQEVDCIFLDQDGQELTLSEYVTVSSPTVRVSVPVLAYKQVTLKCEVIAGGGATEQDVEIDIQPKSIVVTGTPEALKNQPDEVIIRTLDLAQIVQNEEWSVTPELSSGVTIRASSTNVRVSLSFKGLSTRTFTISCADIVRLDNRSDRAFGEENVTITVRGPTAAVYALTPSDIHVTADMVADYDPNTMTVTLKIELDNASTGIIGAPYTVQVIEMEP